MKFTSRKPAARGFRVMHPDTQRVIARLGGKACSSKYGHNWMAAIGAKGGRN